jgi:glutamate synthase domain-containing protein 2
MAERWNDRGFSKRKKEYLSDEEFELARLARDYDTNPTTVRRWQEEARSSRVLDDDRKYREMLEKLGRGKKNEKR